MDTAKAIQLLHRLQDEQFDGIHGDERREALEMAVRTLVEPNIGQKTIDCIIKRLSDEVRTTDDCISRQGAITSFRLDDDGKAWSMEDIIYRLEQFPSAQPEQKTAKWVKTEIGWKCSNCTLCTNIKGKTEFNFCPNCGADMRGKQDE